MSCRSDEKELLAATDVRPSGSGCLL